MVRQKIHLELINVYDLDLASLVYIFFQKGPYLNKEHITNIIKMATCKDVQGIITHKGSYDLDRFKLYRRLLKSR